MLKHLISAAPLPHNRTIALVFLLLLFGMPNYYSYAQQGIDPECDPNFTVSVNGCTVTATSASSTNYFSKWIWGDGTFNNSTASTITHDYPPACNSTYEITREIICIVNNVQVKYTASNTVTINVPTVSVSASASTLTPGCNEEVTISYQICLTGCNPLNSNLTFTAQLDNGLTFVGGDFTLVQGTPTLNVPAASFTGILPSCITKTIRVRNNAGNSSPKSVTLTNTTANCSAIVSPAALTTTLSPQGPKLVTTKTVTVVNGVAIFTVTVTNTGNSTLNDIEVNDVFQSPMIPTFYPSGFSLNGNVLKKNIGTLNPGASFVGEFRFTIPDGICGADLKNEAFAYVPACMSQSNTATAVAQFGIAGFTLVGSNPGSINTVSSILSQLPASGPHRVHVQGTLFIDVPFDIPANSEYLMGSGAEIRVQNNVLLTATNTLFHACHDMWDGITIEDVGNIKLSGCTVMHAQYATHVVGVSNQIEISNTTYDCNYVGFYVAPINSTRKTTGWLLNGNSFICTGSLRQNYTDQFPKHISSTSNLENINPNVIPFAYAGMELYDVPFLNINNSSSTRTLFERLNLGIVATRSNVTATRCDFRDVLPYNSYFNSGAGVTAFSPIGSDHTLIIGNGTIAQACNFINCDYGIRVSGCNLEMFWNFLGTINPLEKIKNTAIFTASCSGKKQYISENRIFSRRKGIELLNSTLSTRSAIIHANRIFIDELPSLEPNANSAAVRLSNMRSTFGATNNSGFQVMVRDNPVIEVNRGYNGVVVQGGYQNWVVQTFNFRMLNLAKNQIGIHINGGDHHGVMSNYSMVGPGTNVADVFPYGIYIDNSPFNKVCGNNVSNFLEDIRITRNSMDMDFAKNNMGPAGLGLHCPQKLNVYPIFGNQIHKGNIWSGNINYSSGLGASQDRRPPFVPNLFIVNTNDNSGACGNPDFEPKQYTPQGWFIPENEGCVESICSWPLHHEPAPLDTLIMTDSLDYEFWANEQKYQDRINLLDKIQHNPSMAGAGSMYANFANNAANENFGKLLNITRQLDDLYQMAPPMATQYEANYNLMDSLSSQIYLLQGQLSAVLSVQDYMAIQQQLDNLWPLYAQAHQNQNLLLANWYAQKSTTAQSILANNNALNSNLAIELNEKWLNSIQLNLFINNSYHLSSAQAAQVLAIAEQCPVAGGNAVYRARGLYAAYHPDYVFANDSLLCAGLSGRSHESKSSANVEKAFRLSPNPSNGMLRIECPSVDKPEGTMIAIIGMDGRVVHQERITNNQAWINLSHIPKGIYVYRLISPTAGNQTGKIILH